VKNSQNSFSKSFQKYLFEKQNPLFISKNYFPNYSFFQIISKTFPQKDKNIHN